MKTKRSKNSSGRESFLQPRDLRQTTGLETIYRKHSAIADPLKLATEFRLRRPQEANVLPSMNVKDRKKTSKKLEVSGGANRIFCRCGFLRKVRGLYEPFVRSRLEESIMKD